MVAVWVGFGMLLEQKNGEWAGVVGGFKTQQAIVPQELATQGAAGYQPVGTFVG